jgi:hypothetical protein
MILYKEMKIGLNGLYFFGGNFCGGGCSQSFHFDMIGKFAIDEMRLESCGRNGSFRRVISTVFLQPSGLVTTTVILVRVD